MKRVIKKMVKYILLFVILYFGFFMIPSTVAAFKVGFETHDSELAGQKAAEVGKILGKKYGVSAFWIILILCSTLYLYSIKNNKRKKEGKK